MRKKLLGLILCMTMLIGISALAGVTASAATVSGIRYIDYDGVEKTCDSATVVDENTTVFSDGDYYVNSNVTLSNAITVSNYPNLIIADGCTLTLAGPDILNFSNPHASQIQLLGQAGKTGEVVLSGATISWDTIMTDGPIANTSCKLTVTDSTFVGLSAWGWAGILNKSGATTIITNSTFKEISNLTEGFSGGAVCNYGSMTITSSAFESNSSATVGSSIYNGNGGTLTVSGCTFTGNSAINGGAIYNQGTLAVEDSTFTGNAVKVDAYGAGGEGGAIDNEGTLTVTDSTFTGNSANNGGAIENGNTATLTVTDSTFKDNSAENASGAINNNNTLTIIRSVFTGNKASYNGGAIYNNKNLTVTGSTFTGNTASSWGGAILNCKELIITGSTFEGNKGSDNGGAIYNFGGTVTVASSAFTENNAVNGGAIYNWGTTVINGNVSFATGNDAIYNKNNIYWDLTDTSATKLEGYEKLENNGNLCISINASQAPGEYVIATGNLSVTVGKDIFTLMVPGDDSGVTVSVDESEVLYSNRIYKLSKDNDKLILTVKKMLTVTGTTVDEKTYDGTTDAVIGQMGTLEGVETGDEVVISSAVAEFSDKNAGKGKDVTVTYTLGGADAWKYEVLSSATIADIEKRTVILTSYSATKEYDGTPITAEEYYITSGSFVGSDGIKNMHFYGSQTKVGSSSNAYNYNVTSFDMWDNYYLKCTPGVLTVTPRTQKLTITAATDSKVYDGTALTNSNYTYTQGDLASGDTLSCVVSSSITNAGTVANRIASYKITNGNGEDVTDYYINVETVDGTLTVSPKQLTVTGTTVENKTYDSTTAATVSANGTLDGVVVGDDVVISSAVAEFSDKNAGNAKDVNVVYTLSGEDAGNYVVAPSTVTANISIAGLYIKKDGEIAPKVYDGTTSATSGSDFEIGDIYAGDDITISSAIAEFLSADAGENVDILFTYTFKGTDADNYLGGEPYTHSDAKPILPRDVTLTSASDTKVYDGTPLTNETVVVGSDGFVGSDGIDRKFFWGTQTNVGSSGNVFGYILNDGTKASNYNIVLNYGTLTVTPAKLTVTPEGSQELKYSETDSLRYKYSGNVTGEIPAFTGTPGIASWAFGNNEITQGTLALDDNGAFLAQNYELVFTRGITANVVSGDIFFADVIFEAYGTYTGDENEAEKITLFYYGEKLEEGVDYEVSYADNVNAGKGTARIIITGMGRFEGETTRWFTIAPADISGFEISAIEDQKYTGGKITPAITVSNEDKVLAEGTDYTVSFDNNRETGKATVTVNGTGNYSGTLTASFNIIEDKTEEEPEEKPEEKTYTIFDLIRLKKALAAALTTGDNTYDINEDGKVDIFDLIRLQKIIAG